MPFVAIRRAQSGDATSLKIQSGAEKRSPVGPFLKWPGGKRWLATDALRLSPGQFNRYYEPFLGSAAMFFGLRPREAILSDTNDELINCYRQIKADWLRIWDGLIGYG